MAPGSVTLREPHTPTHKTNQMPDPLPSCHTHTHTHTHTHVRKIHSGDRLLSPCVCAARLLRSLRQTREILLVSPCPSQTISLSQRTWAPADPPPTSPARLQAHETCPTHIHTHTHTHTYPQARGPLAPARFPWRRDTRRQEVWGEVCVSLLLLEHFRSDPLLTRRLPPPPSLRKQPHPRHRRRAGWPSVITSLMFWCEAGRLRELGSQTHVDMFVSSRRNLVCVCVCVSFWGFSDYRDGRSSSWRKPC